MNEKKTIVFSSIFLIFIIGGLILSLIGRPSDAVDKQVEETAKEEVAEEEEVVFMEFVSSTEYFTNAPAQVIIRLLDYRRQPVSTTCTASVLYPDKTFYFKDQAMSQDPYQNYYYQFTTPDIVGVYTQIANCTWHGTDIINAKTFHIGNSTFYLAQQQNTTHQVVEATYNNTVVILSALNCSDPIYTEICDRLGLIINQTDSIEEGLGNLSFDFNCTDCLQPLTKLYYDINTTDCIVGSYWWFNARVTREEDLVLPFLNCTLITNKWGMETIPFVNETRYYHYEHQCDSEGTITWDFECERT